MDVTIFLEILVGGAIVGALYSLVAAGLNLQYGVMRILNFAHGDFLMLGAYITYFSFVSFGVNPLVSLIICAPIMFVIGILIQSGVLHRLVSTSKSVEELEFKSLLALFGLSWVIENLALILWGSYMRGYTYMSVPVNIGGSAFPLNRIVAAVASVIINVALYLFLRYARAGTAMRATIEEPTAAQLVGVNIFKLHRLTFGLGVLIAACSGTMISFSFPGSITPLMGIPYTAFALMVIIIGGVGSFKGSLVGGITVGYLTYLTMRLIHPGLALAVNYAFFIILLLMKPKGIFAR